MEARSHDTREVLVVDDEADVREAVCELLEDHGYRSLQAANGQEALARLAERLPALIIVDLLMPVMSGLELLQTLRKSKRFRSIPTVVITAANDAMLAIKLDAPLVYKPNLEDLPAIIERILASHPPGTGASATG
jgi:CheY-like chemotaxis protein